MNGMPHFRPRRVLCGCVRLTVDLAWRISVDSAFEGDREGVECGLPPCHPACPTPAGGVKRPRHEIQALDRGGVVREVPPRPYRSPVAGVEGLDRVGRADDAADLDVVVQERDELAP